MERLQRLCTVMVVLFLCVVVKAQDTRYAEHSVLREGAWAKVRVDKSGIFQLTGSLVSSCGFSDIKQVKVYGYGGGLQPELRDHRFARYDLKGKEMPSSLAHVLKHL